MCFIEATVTMKNPSLYSPHFYILENCKYAHTTVKILKIVKIKVIFNYYDLKIKKLKMREN